MTQDDVLVVGAGPAGSVASIVLARAGVRVRMIDRTQFPRDKLCGDTLNPGTLSILDRLRLSDRIRRRAFPITGMHVTGPRAAQVSETYPDNVQGVALKRRELDSMLFEAAVAAGVTVESGTIARTPLLEAGTSRVIGVRVSRQSGDDDARARVVIAADGRHSTLGFTLGLTRYAAAPRRWAFGAYFGGVSGLTTQGEMHIRDDGYIGVAPLPDGIANVCIVRDRSTMTRAPHTPPNAVVDQAVLSDSVLRERFRDARRLTDVTSLGPLAVDAIASGCPGLLLAGDAAGFVDPMTGDGLRFAFRGGELAADAALREISSGQPAFVSLHAARAAEFQYKWRINRALRTLVSSPPSVRVAARVARHWSAPVKLIVRLAGDVNLVDRAAS